MADILKRSETAADVVARTRRRTIKTQLRFFEEPSSEGFYAGEVIEIYGRAGTGKTEMLISATLDIIIPPIFGEVPLEGRGESVIWMDMEHRFPLERITEQLAERLRNASENETLRRVVEGKPPVTCTEEQMDEFLVSCLKRIVVYRCETRLQLLASLIALRDLAGRASTAAGRGGPFALMVIDAIASFYWFERAEEKDKNSVPFQLYQKMARLLKPFLRDAQLPLLVAKPAMYPHDNVDEAPHLIHREYLPPAWQSLVTRRVVLSRRWSPIALPPEHIRQSTGEFMAHVIKPMAAVTHLFNIEADGVHYVGA